MRRVVVYAFLIFSAALAVLISKNTKLKKANAVLKANQENLLTTEKKLRADNTAYNVKVTSLSLKLSEFKKSREEDKKELERLGIKLKRLKAVTKTQIEANIPVKTETKIIYKHTTDTVIPIQSFEQITPYYSVAGMIEKDTVNFKLHIPVTIRQTATKEYKRVFLFFRKLKGIKQEVWTDNPFVDIKYSEHIKLR